jgi:hypothetical protein
LTKPDNHVPLGHLSIYYLRGKMPIQTIEQELQAAVDLASAGTGVPKHKLQEILKTHGEAFAPALLPKRFDGWVESKEGREWQHGEFKQFNYNGGFRAFVGHTVRAFQDKISVSYYPGDSESLQLVTSRRVPTMGDLFRLAQEIKLPLEYKKRG